MSNTSFQTTLLFFARHIVFLYVLFGNLTLNGQGIAEKVKSLLPGKLDSAEMVVDHYYQEVFLSGNDTEQARANFLRGLIYYYKGKLYLASDYYKKALNSDLARTDPKFAEACWNNLGISYDLLGMKAEALEALQRSLTFAEKRQDKFGMAQTWINIGLLEVNFGNLKNGVRYFTEALDFFTEETTDSLNIALCHQNLARACSLEEDLACFELHSNTGLEIFRKINYPLGEAQMLNNIAQARTRQGNHEAAHAFFRQALATAEQAQNPILTATILFAMAEDEVAHRNYKEAKKKYVQCLNLYETAQATDFFSPVYIQLIELSAAMHEIDSHDYYLNAFIQHQEKQSLEKSKTRFDELKVIYEYEKHLEEISRQKDDIQQKKQSLFLLSVLLVVTAGAFFLALHFLQKNRRLIRSLFDQQKKEILHERKQIQTEKIKKEVKPLDEPGNEKGDAPHLESTNSSSDYQPDSEDQVTDEKLILLFERIEQLMKEEKVYTDNEFSQSKLSALLTSNETYVSRAINQIGNKNFSTYVNEYRVKEAKQIMLDAKEKINLKFLPERVGIKSKSTFYRIFKSMTGLTPAEFLEEANKNK